MDSLTQIVLGSGVASAVIGRQIGRRAVAWGALCGTLPDLDVLVRFVDPVAQFTYHRSASHSLLVLTALTPLLVWLARRVHGPQLASRGRWFLALWLALITHPLLDALTVYGTQLWWPLTDYPVSIASVFIIDPLYTLPLLAAMVLVWRQRGSAASVRWNNVALAVSSLYLLWGGGAKLWTEHRVQADLVHQQVQAERVLTVPAAFTTLLWRVVVIDGDRFREGFYSLVDGDAAPHWGPWQPRHAELLAPLAGHWPVARLQSFTHGYYAAAVDGAGRVSISDLRMGQQGQYFFSFVVGQQAADGSVSALPTQRAARDTGGRALGWQWQRLWDAATPWPETNAQATDLY